MRDDTIVLSFDNLKPRRVVQLGKGGGSRSASLIAGAGKQRPKSSVNTKPSFRSNKYKYSNVVEEHYESGNLMRPGSSATYLGPGKGLGLQQNQVGGFSQEALLVD